MESVPKAISGKGLEACLVFGEASVAVLRLTEDLARAGITSGPVAVSHEELLAAHDELRDLFGSGMTEGVAELALTVLVLAERTALLLEDAS